MDKNNNAVWEKYSKTTHFIGRLVSAITVIMLVGAPFLIGKYLGAFPSRAAGRRTQLLAFGLNY